MLKQLTSLLGEYRKDAILAPLFILVEVAMELLIPYLVSGLIDYGVLGSGGIVYTIKIGALMVFMAIAALAFGALAGRFAARACTGLSANIRDAMFEKITEFSFSNIDHFSSASLITRLTSDVNNVQNAFLMFLRLGLQAPIQLIGATAMAVLISRRLSVIFLAAIPVLAITMVYMMKNGYPRFQEMLKRVDDMNASVQENLNNIRVVKSYVREEYESQKFAEQTKTLQNTQFIAERLILFTLPILQLTIFGCIVAVVWLGGNLVIQKGLELGQLSAFISYISQILISLMFLSMIFLLSVLSRASVTRIQEVLAESPSISDSPSSTLTPNDGSIEFVDASFSYGDSSSNLALHHISLSIKSGETIGIIGGTGSAKSTLVQLLPRLYELSSGKLYVGGNPVEDYSFQALRSAVALVLQKSTLFTGSVRQNLLWGNPNATEEELIHACCIAQIMEFIKTLPNGFDTHVEQGGTNFSGGQKQRLCIARTLLTRPKIIVFDDSTSAVDTTTDSRIHEGIRRELHGTTILIISQRIASLRGADRIIVMENGSICGVGTHEELLTGNAIYREIANLQEKGGLVS
ncbi:ABC transporter ATP-binding protein [Clostridium merdae]|uniref:ABC transporter ATP-binding protein n=1 Tax=Clostridium merdae TaxID=1958780 RepID=UPI000A26CDBC|nr:ABC transporter ATP-binding protein [Clostridium merdae]